MVRVTIFAVRDTTTRDRRETEGDGKCVEKLRSGETRRTVEREEMFASSFE
jgi:hypothetical protein